jgi:hypothetical protein
MNFSHTLQQVLDGTKTQTRRPVKPGEYGVNSNGIVSVFTGKDRLKWQVGREYRICPGRGKSAVGLMWITGIHIEHVQDIDEHDAMCEGAPYYDDEDSFILGFREIWDGIYGRDPNFCWEANPAVWVLDIEVSEDWTVWDNLMKGLAEIRKREADDALDKQ